MPIRISSQFRPMTYDELSKPLIQATEALMALEDLYSAMLTEAAKWLLLANEQTDHRAYTLLKAYSDDLSTLADALLRQGLTPSSRAAMLDMKRRYATDISPIEEAYNKREKLSEEQRLAMMKDLTLRFSTNFSNVSLDELIRNPNLLYEALSGAMISKRVGDIANNYAKAITSDPLLSKVMNNLYWQLRLLLGYTPQLILLEASNDPNAPSELKGIRDAIHQELKGNAAYNKDWVDAYINQGMSSAIGTTKYDYSRNLGLLTAAEQLHKEEVKERRELQRRTAVYDPTHAEEYSDIEDYPGYVMHNKSKYIFSKETGLVVSTNLALFKKEYAESLQAAEVEEKRKERIKEFITTPLYFGGDKFEIKRLDKNSFTEKGSKPIDFYDLTLNAQNKLRMILADMGLRPEDVNISKDQDIFNRNEYKITLKSSVIEQLNFNE